MRRVYSYILKIMEISSSLLNDERDEALYNVRSLEKQTLRLRYRTSILKNSRGCPYGVFIHPWQFFTKLTLISNLDDISTMVDYDYIYFAQCNEIISCLIDQQRYVNQSIPSISVIVDRGRYNAWKVFGVIVCAATNIAFPIDQKPAQISFSGLFLRSWCLINVMCNLKTCTRTLLLKSTKI